MELSTEAQSDSTDARSDVSTVTDAIDDPADGTFTDDAILG